MRISFREAVGAGVGDAAIVAARAGASKGQVGMALLDRRGQNVIFGGTHQSTYIEPGSIALDHIRQ
jgi:hypothetical protein